MAAEGATGSGGLKQNLGLVSATTLIVGSAIGSGIFLLPSTMAAQVGSPALLLLVWVVCGVVSLFGALTFAEMAGMYPRAGGQYLFLREAWGAKTAFLYGWTFFWVIQTGIIAAVATAFALFVSVLYPMSAFAVKLVAIGCILSLSLVNYLGVKYGGAVQNVFTFLKVGAILALVVVGFALAESRGSAVSFEGLVPAAGVVGGFGLAMLAAFFAYDGWNQASFVASEIKDPQRNVPRAMLLGVLIVAAVYVAATMVYLHVLPFDQVVPEAGGQARRLAADVARVAVGENGVVFITLAIIVSTFGTVNAFVLSGPRVYYAMAKDGLFLNGMKSVSPKFGTPDFATIIQAEWACLLVLTGTYTDLVNYSVFAIWLFYGITGVGLFILRRKARDHPRPYRTWGYPVVPALFVAASVFIVVNTLRYDARNALMGLLLIASGIPFLWYFTRRGVRRVPVRDQGLDVAASTRERDR